MPLLKIVQYPEQVLLTVGKPFAPEEFTPDLEKLVEDMFETMYDAGGLGLAAPQIGLSRRMFVMDIPADKEDGRPGVKQAFFNPEVITAEGEQYGDEGCLSFPGIYQKIMRNNRTVVRAQDVKGELFEMDVTELAARCVLHETDHCDGIVFLDRMSVLKRELAKRKIKKMQQTGKWE